MLDVPEVFRKVNVIAVRVLKTLDLIPEMINLIVTVGLDLFDVGQIIDTLAVFKYLRQDRFDLNVGKGLALPGVDGVEEGDRAFRGTSCMRNEWNRENARTGRTL